MLRSYANRMLRELVLLAPLLVAQGSGVAAQAQDSAAAGDPELGDTSAGEQPSGRAGQDFSVDEAPPDARASSAAEPTPAESRPASVRQYGRRDPFMPLRLDAHVALTWEGSFGVGVRADFPLINGTFRYSTRDELAISVGADLTFVSFSGSRVIEVLPTAVLQWSLGISERTFLYPELGLVGHVDGGQWEGLHPNIGFGARYYLHRSLSLQGRLGWPVALSGGVTF
ncbi:MAG: hypothetical protein JWN04_2233 [Myxococcaceae bacterium]|nr:hypothetical protein [Myxococcaceae bacterium]